MFTRVPLCRAVLCYAWSLSLDYALARAPTTVLLPSLLLRFTDSICPSLQVRKTQSGIKHVLTERYYAWEDAQHLAQMDPEIDLSGNGPLYVPHGSSSYLENEMPWEKEDKERAGGSKATEGSADETKKTVDGSTIPDTVKPQQEAPRA